MGRAQKGDGGADLVGLSQPPRRYPFDVRALVLNGEITLTVEGIDYAYREGDIFVMPAGHVHAEAIGPDGVDYLVGRRTADATSERQEA